MKTYKIFITNVTSVKVEAEDILKAIINTLATFDFIKVEEIEKVTQIILY